MKFNFKIQEYQSDAVNAVKDVFQGQPKEKSYSYLSGYKDKSLPGLGGDDYLHYSNNEIQLSEGQLERNIVSQQQKRNIRESDFSNSQNSVLNNLALDVEMETGTGKTYVYIKTMFELNKEYGWSKFIVVVPSIAIREGVKKSFEMTRDHFMETYGKKARCFIYNSSNLNELNYFAESEELSVMIINIQAFNKDLKEGKGGESLIIYSKRDEFSSRRPIDVISNTKPILILDEPQKMGGEATKKGLKNFNPLFFINYSATLKEEHNLVYVLDALDAYNKHLVKKIEVKGIEFKNLTGTNKYIYVDKINTSPSKAPEVKMEIEVKQKDGIKRKSFIFKKGDDLYKRSDNAEEYKDGFIIQDIDAREGSVTFLNGFIIYQGEIYGDQSEETMRRIQIRETIKSHFEKERSLFKMGIKTLSLFFIDEVKKYRQYDESGKEILGEYGVIFEEEYNKELERVSDETSDEEYKKYLLSFDTSRIHSGYFSIDKKGHYVDSTLKNGSDISDDTSAYDLILKDKERLLSFSEPVRFIFSHSALREGWDNPNVFQIGTLKKSDSTTLKRQEVGRGLRLSVDKDGNRMDEERCGKRVQEINKLTVISSESYSDFVSHLQSDIKENLYIPSSIVSEELFLDRIVKTDDGNEHKINRGDMFYIYKYLFINQYVDFDWSVSDIYKKDLECGKLKSLPPEIKNLSFSIHQILQSTFKKNIEGYKIENGNKPKVERNTLTQNFSKKEFQELWKEIKHKYVYEISFESKVLIENSLKRINSDEFYIEKEMVYLVKKGEMEGKISKNNINESSSFSSVKTYKGNEKIKRSSLKYDLIGRIAEETRLKRKTIGEILYKMNDDKFKMFSFDSEKFISLITKIIKSEKVRLVLDDIVYDKTNEEYRSDVLLSDISILSENVVYGEKLVQSFTDVDGSAKDSIEKKFLKDLDSAEEVSSYAKLPCSFSIPTPLGNYTPDWAIAFNDNSGIKHIYFIAETKGSMDTDQLRWKEKAKTECAKKLFNEQKKAGKVRYGVADSYENLFSLIKSIK